MIPISVTLGIYMMTIAYPFNYLKSAELYSRTGVSHPRDKDGGGVDSSGTVI